MMYKAQEIFPHFPAYNLRTVTWISVLGAITRLSSVSVINKCVILTHLLNQKYSFLK